MSLFLLMDMGIQSSKSSHRVTLECMVVVCFPASNICCIGAAVDNTNYACYIQMACKILVKRRRRRRVRVSEVLGACIIKAFDFG